MGTTRILAATAVAGVLGLTAAAAGAWLSSDDGRPDPGDSSLAPSILGAPDGTVLAAGLLQPADCTDLAATMTALAEEHGWYGGGGRVMPLMATTDEAAADASVGGGDAAQESAGAPTADGDQAGFDTTNVQEVGVDEPDVVERLGAGLLVVGTEGMVRVVDISGDQPVARGELAVQEWGGDLGLLAVGEDRVAVLASADGLVREDEATSMIRPGGWGTTLVTLVDVSDPDAPRELSRMELEGSLVDARAVDGVLRLAVRSDGPQVDVHALGEFEADREMDWENASEEDYRRYEEAYQAELEERMAQAMAQLEPEHWQPHAAVDGRVVPMVDCERIGFPTAFAGLGTLTMAAVDATGDTLAIDDSAAVVAAGENLYATPDRVVIATTRWEPFDEGEPMPVEPEPLPEEEVVDPFFEEGEAEDDQASATAAVLPMATDMMIAPWGGPGGSTDLHVFDVEGTIVSHVASGHVDGTLLNQYAMSIHEGVLRTATTAWDAEGSESYVTTFRVEGTDLVQLGQVGDLGPDEDIQAVRFMGTTAYVVTFRRTDPLYVVDLTDPAAPRTRGELKIEGYSAHLQPLGEGQLLGVGQDADPETGMTRGVQVSTFDVADPTAPSRIDVDVTPDSNSEVEWEPHALTITADRHAVVPVEIWGDSPTGRLGAVVYRVDAAGGLDRVGLLNTGSDWLLRPRRTIDLGDTLLTVGDRGVIAWDRGTFEPVTTVTFDAPPSGERGDEGGAAGGGTTEPGFDAEG